ncbi:MAG TPA: hypothetical protein VFP71_02945 [Candidatus Angelobacter sp.]|nr:hypothetical protein [Candidatus Angelobacter sp.]
MPVTVGVKLRLMVGAEPAGTTVTVTVFVTWRPFESVAVAVYVVVWDGDTDAEPSIGSGPDDTAGEMVNDAAFVTFHERVAVCP